MYVYELKTLPNTSVNTLLPSSNDPHLPKTSIPRPSEPHLPASKQLHLRERFGKQGASVSSNRKSCTQANQEKYKLGHFHLERIVPSKEYYRTYERMEPQQINQLMAKSVHKATNKKGKNIPSLKSNASLYENATRGLK